MTDLKLCVVSLRYSSWSMRAWLALTQAGASFAVETADLPEMQRQARAADGSLRATVPDLTRRRALGSVSGLFPVLWVGASPSTKRSPSASGRPTPFPMPGCGPASRSPAPRPGRCAARWPAV